MTSLQQLMLKALPMAANDQCLGGYRVCQQLGAELGRRGRPPAASRDQCSWECGRWRSWPVGWRRGSADRAWRRYLSGSAETLFQNYQFDGSGGHGGLSFGSAARTRSGLSPRRQPGEAGRYHSIRRHTICTGCLTQLQGRADGRGPFWRAACANTAWGRSSLCGCCHRSLTSRNSVVDGHERVVMEQQIRLVEIDPTNGEADPPRRGRGRR